MTSNFEVNRSRSPRYPRYALDAAIGYARRLYDGAHRSLVDTNTAYKVMGFAGKTGPSATALGAIRQYGLIDAPKGGVRISSLGLEILEPGSQVEYIQALHVAADQPTVFAQLAAHFAEGIPNSDEPLRAYLIRHLGFTKKGADECISSFRETHSFLEARTPLDRVQESPVENDDAFKSSTRLETEVNDSTPGIRTSQSITPSTDLLVVPLTKDCRVEMRFYGDLTERALTKLARYIDLMKEDWADQ